MKSQPKIIFLALLVILSMLFSLISFPQLGISNAQAASDSSTNDIDWIIQNITVTPPVTKLFSLAQNKSGKTCVAYEAAETLSVSCRLPGKNWTTLSPLFTPTIGSSTTLDNASLAIGDDGIVRIAYTGWTSIIGNKLYYARWLADSYWNIEQIADYIDNAVFSLAVDSNSKPYLAYALNSSVPGEPIFNTSLYLAQKGTSGWFTLQLTPGNPDNGTIERVLLAIDIFNLPHVSYVYNYTKDYLKNIRFSNTTTPLSATTLYSNTLDASFTLDLDGNDRLVANGDNYLIYFRRMKDGGWINRKIEAVTSDYKRTTIALVSSGAPYIQYYDATHNVNKIANWDGTSYIIQVVPGTGVFSNMIIDSYNRIYLAYLDDNSGALKLYSTNSVMYFPAAYLPAMIKALK